MSTVPVYDAQGKRIRAVEVAPARFDSQVRHALLKEALLAHLASRRQGGHDTKDRGRVQGGGAKPWRQKGTGRARHGSIRSPIWSGGGIAHGPHPRDYAYRLPAKQRRLALRSAIRHRLEEERVCAIEGLAGPERPRTKAVAACLRAAGLADAGVLMVSEEHDRNLYLSVRNLPAVELVERRNLGAGPILQRTWLVFCAEALDALTAELEEVTA